MKLLLRSAITIFVYLGSHVFTSDAFFLPSCENGRNAVTRYRSTLSARENREEEALRFYLDISVAGEEIGRLIFCIPRPDSIFPKHTENILKLVEGSSAGLDPRLSYKNCEFQYSPQFIESFPQYRWAHNLPGRGRNAVGRAEERIVDVESMQGNTFRMYGGIYYGLEYSTIPETNAGILTVPMTGPSRGSTGLTIVRVADSPPEWKERLLLNSAIIGWLEEGSSATLKGFQQTNGPPTVKASGVL